MPNREQGIAKSGAERLRLDNTQNVGGNTSPKVAGLHDT